MNNTQPSTPSTPNELFVSKSVKLTKQYCLLKHNKTQIFKAKKKPYDDELAQLQHGLLEWGVSIKKVNACRVIFEKTKDMADVTNINAIAETPEEKALKVYEIIFNDFGFGNASAFMHQRYVEAKDLVINYVKRYYEIKEELAAIKIQQDDEISELRSKILDQGIPGIQLSYVYNRFKTDWNLRQIADDVESDYFEDIYDKLKADLFKEAKGNTYA